MKNKARVSLILLIALCTFTACNKLTRGKAKEEIIKKQQLPQSETVKLNKKFLKDHQFVGGFPKVCLTIGIDHFSSYEKKLLDLQSQGFITLKDDEYYDDCNDLYTNVLLTEKGKKDLIKEDDGIYTIKLCSIEFGDITGIVEYKEFGGADVHYTLKRTDYTDFGKMVNGNKEQPETIERLANFTKYDNGWRMGK